MRQTGARTELNGSARVQTKVGPRDFGVLYNNRLYSAGALCNAVGKDTDMMCMLVLAE